MEIFREISVGGLEKEPLIQRLIDSGIQFNAYAETLFSHRLFSPGLRAEKARLVKLTAADLGLAGSYSYQAVLDQALSRGLKLCPLYLGAFLRLECLSQPAGPYLTVASPRPESDESYPAGFYLRNSGNALWLRGYRVEGEAEWPPDNEFIFLG